MLLGVLYLLVGWYRCIVVLAEPEESVIFSHIIYHL